MVKTMQPGRLWYAEAETKRVLTAPYAPPVFAGDEYGDPAPFLLLIVGDETLINDMRKGTP